MRWTRILGIALIVLGLAAVALRTVGYTSQRSTFESEAIEIHVEEKERLPVPVWLGVALAVTGGALLLIPSRPRG